jgi:hypothetical protein
VDNFAPCPEVSEVFRYFHKTERMADIRIFFLRGFSLNISWDKGGRHRNGDQAARRSSQ